MIGACGRCRHQICCSICPLLAMPFPPPNTCQGMPHTVHWWCPWKATHQTKKATTLEAFLRQSAQRLDFWFLLLSSLTLRGPLSRCVPLIGIGLAIARGAQRNRRPVSSVNVEQGVHADASSLEGLGEGIRAGHAPHATSTARLSGMAWASPPPHMAPTESKPLGSRHGCVGQAGRPNLRAASGVPPFRGGRHFLAGAGPAPLNTMLITQATLRLQYRRSNQPSSPHPPPPGFS